MEVAAGVVVVAPVIVALIMVAIAGVDMSTLGQHIITTPIIQIARIFQLRLTW